MVKRCLHCNALLLLAAGVAVGCATAVVPPILLESGVLEYPPSLKEQRLEGSVLVVYDVDIDGEVMNVSVVESDPPEVFDEAALAFVRTWRFQPKQVDGLPVVASAVHSRISFATDDADATYLEFLK